MAAPRITLIWSSSTAFSSSQSVCHISLITGYSIIKFFALLIILIIAADWNVFSQGSYFSCPFYYSDKQNQEQVRFTFIPLLVLTEIFMELSSVWEANSHPSIQKILRLLWKSPLSLSCGRRTYSTPCDPISYRSLLKLLTHLSFLQVSDKNRARISHFVNMY
jgi:hypothetical protein